MEIYLSVNVQDKFLSKLREQQTPSTIFTINGFQVRGTIKEYDEISVLVESGGTEQLIYKHAISTIAPFQRIEEHKQNSPYLGRPQKDFDHW